MRRGEGEGDPGELIIHPFSHTPPDSFKHTNLLLSVCLKFHEHTAVVGEACRLQEETSPSP